MALRWQISGIFRLLDPATRRGLGWMYVLMGLSAVLEMAGLGLLVPLLQVLLSPESADHLPLVGPLLAGWLEQDAGGALVTVCAMVAGFFLIKSAVLAYIGWAQNDFVLQHQARYAEHMLRSYISGPYEALMGRNSAELVRNVTLLTMRLFVKGVLPVMQIGTELLMATGVVALMMLLDPWMTLAIGAAIGTATLGFYALLRRKLLEWGRRTLALDSESLLWLNQSLAAPKITKLAGLEEFFVTAFARPTRARARLAALTMTAPTWPRLFLEAVAVVTLVMVIIVAVIVQGRSSAEILPILAVLGLAAIRLLPSASKMVGALTLLRENYGAVDILTTETAKWHAAARASGGSVLPPFSGEVRLEGISYAYPGTTAPVLSGIDLVIRNGASVGLVGHSGAGKTTLADLILGLVKPSAGRILVDGVPLATDPAGWHRQIGYVPQDVYLLDDTLARNVALGVPDAEIDRDWLAEVLHMARLDEFVAALPLGTATMMGERGSLVSGGQRQRIGIARALYRRPRLLVLDEATSALDAETEHQISEAIGAMAGHTTLVIIAHRLSTIRHCHEIVFMDRGRIVDTGTFAELNESCPDFSRLVALSGSTHA